MTNINAMYSVIIYLGCGCICTSCHRQAEFGEENVSLPTAPLSSTMIDYYGNAPGRWCVFVAHGIWPFSDQRALRKGVVPSQGDIKEAVLTARQEQRTD